MLLGKESLTGNCIYFFRFTLVLNMHAMAFKLLYSKTKMSESKLRGSPILTPSTSFISSCHCCQVTALPAHKYKMLLVFFKDSTVCRESGHNSQCG